MQKIKVIITSLIALTTCGTHAWVNSNVGVIRKPLSSIPDAIILKDEKLKWSEHGFCKRGHEMTPENSYIQPNDGKRRCRECKKLRRGKSVKAIEALNEELNEELRKEKI